MDDFPGSMQTHNPGTCDWLSAASHYLHYVFGNSLMYNDRMPSTSPNNVRLRWCVDKLAYGLTTCNNSWI